MPSNAFNSLSKNAPTRPIVCKKSPPPPPPSHTLKVTIVQDTARPFAHVNVTIATTSEPIQGVHVVVTATHVTSGSSSYNYNATTPDSRLFGFKCGNNVNTQVTTTATFNDGTVLTDIQVEPLT